MVSFNDMRVNGTLREDKNKMEGFECGLLTWLRMCVKNG